MKSKDHVCVLLHISMPFSSLHSRPRRRRRRVSNWREKGEGQRREKREGGERWDEKKGNICRKQKRKGFVVCMTYRAIRIAVEGRRREAC